MSVAVRLWRVLTVGAALMAAVALVGNALSYYDSHTETRRIRQAQLESCLKVNDPVRVAVVQLIRDQIAATKRIKPSLFPSIPPETFKRLFNRQQADRQRVLVKLRRAPSCEQRFGRD